MSQHPLIIQPPLAGDDQKRGWRRLGSVHIWGRRQFPKRYARDCTLHPGRPKLVMLENVIADPAFPCLYTQNGERIAQSRFNLIPHGVSGRQVAKDRKRARFEPLTIDPSNAARVEETITYGGPRHSHYGHFLVDGMNRLWHDDDRPVLRLNGYPGTLPLRKFVRTLERAGREREMFSVKRKTIFDRVLLPVPAIQNQFVTYGNVDEEHLAITDQLLPQANIDVPPKVFLSRREIKRRPSQGERELQQHLERADYVEICPEKLPLAEQIAIFNRAKWIVGLNGSAFHNSLFTRRDSDMQSAQIFDGNSIHRFVMIDQTKGLNSHFLETAKADVEGEKVVGQRLDVDGTLNRLEEIRAI